MSSRGTYERLLEISRWRQPNRARLSCGRASPFRALAETRLKDGGNTRLSVQYPQISVIANGSSARLLRLIKRDAGGRPVSILLSLRAPSPLPFDHAPVSRFAEESAMEKRRRRNGGGPGGGGARTALSISFIDPRNRKRDLVVKSRGATPTKYGGARAGGTR